MVTGRAGWMGMGRGAGRSALGLWPTLAVLLCSFPAGKTQPAGSPLLDLPARVGVPDSPAPWGPRFPSPRVFVPCPAQGAMDVRGDLEVRELLPELRRIGANRGDLQSWGCFSAPLPSSEKTGALDAFWVLQRRGEGEARTPHQGHFLQLLAHQFANLLVAQGWSWGRWGGPRLVPDRPVPPPRWPTRESPRTQAQTR